MALVDAGMPCALCRAPIDDPMRDTFATTMWGIDDDRFAKLDDAACHQACIDKWELRDQFLTYYNGKCKNELYIDRNGHVSYRVDYVNLIGNAMVITFAVLFCFPSLALLELKWRTHLSRVLVFLLPYLLLAGFVVCCTMQSSLRSALFYGLIAWATTSLMSLVLALVTPAFLPTRR